MLDQLRAYVEATLDALRPCSAGIVVSKGGETVYEAYLPGPELQQPESSIEDASLWPLFSATKSFAATVLLSFAHDGRLSLDDPVAEYVPEFADPGDGPFGRDQITLRHLASHTSGLALPDERPDPDVDLSGLLVESKPGEVFVYSWLGMLVLERAIEAVAGQDFEIVMRSRVLDPLGLDHTRYIYEYDPKLPMLPCRAGDHADVGGHFVQSRRGHRVGSGLYGTTRDLNRFSQLWLNGGTMEGRTYFAPSLRQEAWALHSVRPSDGGRYGLLWWLFEEEGGYAASGASQTASAVVPESGAVVTVTRNHIGPHPLPFSFVEDKRQLVRFGSRLR